MVTYSNEDEVVSTEHSGIASNSFRSHHTTSMASASAATLQCDLTQCDLTCPASLNFARWALIAMSRCAAVIMMGLLCVAYCLTCHASAQRHSQLSNLYFGH